MFDIHIQLFSAFSARSAFSAVGPPYVLGGESASGVFALTDRGSGAYTRSPIERFVMLAECHHIPPSGEAPGRQPVAPGLEISFHIDTSLE